MTVLVSSVGRATCYVPDGSRVKSQWAGRRGGLGFTQSSGPDPLGVHPASHTMSTGLFPGVKPPRRGV